MSNGVKIGATSVDTAVTVTESAKLAFARKHITLEARPLGQQPTRMIPAATSSGKLNNLATVKPTSGIIV